jgi:hypothetical protein
MAKPNSLTLKYSEKKQVLSMFKGSKMGKPIKDARKISEFTGLPKLQVMLFLEEEGLRSYSLGSYQ